MTQGRPAAIGGHDQGPEVAERLPTAELTEFISIRVASGRYLSASEVVRAGLRLLERDEANFAAAISGAPRGKDARNVGDVRD